MLLFYSSFNITDFLKRESTFPLYEGYYLLRWIIILGISAISVERLVFLGVFIFAMVKWFHTQEKVHYGLLPKEKQALHGTNFGHFRGAY